MLHMDDCFDRGRRWRVIGLVASVEVDFRVRGERVYSSSGGGRKV